MFSLSYLGALAITAIGDMKRLRERVASLESQIADLQRENAQGSQSVELPQHPDDAKWANGDF